MGAKRDAEAYLPVSSLRRFGLRVPLWRRRAERQDMLLDTAGIVCAVAEGADAAYVSELI